MADDIQGWVRAWFEKRNPGVEIDDAVNFYTSGYVDSFGIIEFIDAAETHFDIQFSDEEFKMESFRTIAGVSGIIAGKASSG